MPDQPHDPKDPAPDHQAGDAPSGKEGTTESDKTLPEDQETFQPEST